MYFIACVCPADLDKKIIAYKHWMKDRFGTVVALKAPSHITLVRPFWLEEEREPEIQLALQSTPVTPGELLVELENFSHFTNRVIFINVKNNSLLTDLKRTTETHFANLFPEIIKPENRIFQPHVTIANRDLRPGDFEKAWPHFSSRSFVESFAVHSISLLKLVAGQWQVIGTSKSIH